MEYAIAIALAVGFGFVLGLIVGARRAFNLVLSGRSVRGSAARIARFMPETVPSRSSKDVLAGIVRVHLGAAEFTLPVLPRAAAARWLDDIDKRFGALAAALSEAGDDTPQIMSRLVAETDALYDMLLSFDQSHLLPRRDEIDEIATDAQILHAVLEVWAAVHPLVASLTAAASGTGTTYSEPSSSPLPPTAGDLTTSSSA